jgi:hypothetical protein
MTFRNPAALAAFARGDLDNFMVAATPGGIEAQEAAGQAMLCAAAQLPKEMRGCTREQLEMIGFKFGADVDQIFVSCTLPPGWKKQATDHSMYSDLLDEQGRKRASIFYKAAFYDRRADISMSRRYNVETYAKGSSKESFRVIVKDCEKEIHALGETADYNERQQLGDQAYAWLAEKYPEWENPFAYWS